MAQPAPEAFIPQLEEQARQLAAAITRDGRQPSYTDEQSLLRGLSFSLNLIEEHERDRDLSKTGTSIIIIGGPLDAKIRAQPSGEPIQGDVPGASVESRILNNGILTQQVLIMDEPAGLREDPIHPLQHPPPPWLHCYTYAGGALKLNEHLAGATSGEDSNGDMEGFSLRLSRSYQSGMATSDPWADLTTPRCLSLWSRYDVSEEQLERQWQIIQDYQICGASASLFLQGSTVGPPMGELWRQMCDLRLALGLQESATHRQDDAKASCYVALSEMQRLEQEEGAAQATIRVRRYRASDADRPEASSDSNQAAYHWGARVRLEFGKEYCPAAISVPKRAGSLEYPWEAMDNMVAGNDMREDRSGSYWQIRLLLIPAGEAPRNSLIMATAANEILDDEELRVAGFIKFCEAFQRVALSRPSPTSSGSDRLRSLHPTSHKLSSIEFLKIQLTTLSCTAYARGELEALSGNRQEGVASAAPPNHKAGDEGDGRNLDVVSPDEDESKVEHVAPLSKTDSLERVAVMMQHPLFGLSIKNRRWHWRIYRSVFVGSMAVDWILKFFTDIESREEAVEFGNGLLDAGVWEHIFGTHGFLDGYYYYRFGPNYDLRTLRQSNPKILKTVSSREDMGDPSRDSATAPMATDAEDPMIVMSRSVLINADVHREDAGRREWAFLHYDSSHNPRNPFHIRLHWSICSSRLIDDLIQAWARRATQCGFALVEAPVEDPRADGLLGASSALVVELACAPPKVEELQERLGQDLGIGRVFFLEELLRQHGFVLDHESDAYFPEPGFPHGRLHWSYWRQRHELPQYIHQSGVALVQIQGDRLLWTPNRLFLATSSGRCLKRAQQHQPYSLERELRERLVGLCSDAEALEGFWREILESLGKKVGIESILDNIPDDMTEAGEDWDGSPETVLDRLAMLEQMIARSL